MSRLTIALAKGRLLEPSACLLERVGIRSVCGFVDSRRLVAESVDGAYRFLVVKPVDVPTYVEYGIADMGIVGKDVLLEEARDVYEPVDLGLARCRLVVAARCERIGDALLPHRSYRVATKYPNVARRYFQERGIQIETIRLSGSVELAPLTGLADLVLDLVETGKTLAANGLHPIAEVADSSARLIVNRASRKLNAARINAFIERLKGETV